MQVRCTVQSPALVLLDNHESHLSLEVLDYAKEHGIIMLSFPPHCSHMMQPLDKTVYGPFKKFYAAAMKGWMADNKGQPLSIYNIPSLVAKAYPKAMTPENIMAGFKATGIFPHDRNVFPPQAFLPALVTDRPDPTAAQQSVSVAAAGLDETSSTPAVEPSVVPAPSDVSEAQVDSASSIPAVQTETRTPETSSAMERSVISDPPVICVAQHNSPVSAEVHGADSGAYAGNVTDSSKVFTPSDIRPFTRAPPRKRQGASRSGSTRILTDTPVKNEIATRKQKKAKEKTGTNNSNLPQQQSGDSTPKPLSKPAVKKRLNYGRPTSDREPPNRKRKCGPYASANDDNPACLYCDGLYLDSRNEYRPWIQCQGVCSKWCHRVCAGVDGKDKQFMCEFCS